MALGHLGKQTRGIGYPTWIGAAPYLNLTPPPLNARNHGFR